MVKTLTRERNMNARVRREVVDVLREILSDPDAGLKFTSAVVRRLKQSQQAKRQGRIASLSSVLGV